MCEEVGAVHKGGLGISFTFGVLYLDANFHCTIPSCVIERAFLGVWQLLCSSQGNGTARLPLVLQRLLFVVLHLSQENTSWDIITGAALIDTSSH